MLLLIRVMLATPLVVAALVALLSLSGVVAHVVPLHPRMSGLHSRQIPIPAECYNYCQDLFNRLNSCTSVDCFCTGQNLAEATDCVDCLGSDISDGQELIDELADACAVYGVTLTVPTVVPSSIPSGESTATLTIGNLLPPNFPTGT